MYKYFFTSDYTLNNLTAFNNVTFGSLNDVKVQYTPSYAIYVASASGGIFYKYDENLNGIGSLAPPTIAALTIASNNYIYGSDGSFNNKLHKVDSDLTSVNVTLLDGTFVAFKIAIKFNPFNQLVYEADSNRRWLNAFDLDLNRVATSSINLNSLSFAPRSIAFYNSASTNLIYVSFDDGFIRLYNTLTTTLSQTITSSCKFVFDMLIDESIGYLLLSCGSNIDNRVDLWETDGSTHKYTNKALSIVNPRGLDYDKNGRLFVASNKNKVCIFE